MYCWKVRKGGKDQESILSGTTPDPGYQRESDSFTIVSLLFMISLKDHQAL